MDPGLAVRARARRLRRTTTLSEELTAGAIIHRNAPPNATTEAVPFCSQDSVRDGQFSNGLVPVGELLLHVLDFPALGAVSASRAGQPHLAALEELVSVAIERWFRDAAASSNLGRSLFTSDQGHDGLGSPSHIERQLLAHETSPFAVGLD